MSDLPGAPPLPPGIAARVAAALSARPGAPPPFTNRLILETSPYLAQHAHDPVAWWPWGEEAFDEARRTGRPVFLSVGYSTCHWCHVMERESFEDEEIARLLNERFVPVKVDREERPDVDAVYMAAVQALIGGGGWPLSVFLRPDGEPFFGGTYFPARDGDRGPTRGFLSILREIAAVWERDPDRVREAAGALGGAVRTALAGRDTTAAGDLPGPGPILDAVRLFARAFDPAHGGVRGAPKFPSGLPVRLLLRHHRRTGDAASLHGAVFTLERMAAGGLMDQVGGGFHRYSTDERWLVPHFEKMLYDNALLAVAYVEAWQVTRRRDLARVARQTLDHLLREMAAPDGGFYSATDADSEGEEGRFFVWSEAELRSLLGGDAEPFMAFHGVTPEGNFEGRNVLWVPRPDEERWEALAAARATLYEARARRVHPMRDEKILAAWNGLALSALATAGAALGEPRYLAAAARAAAFVLDRMRPAGRLARSWRDGALGPPGFLQDHAFLVQGLLDLHQATFDPRWLEEAVALAERMERLFADPRGGWFSAGADQERLIAREKPTHDGAEPSGASVALRDALRLEAFTGDGRWRAIAAAALRWYAPELARRPAALTEMLIALDAWTDAAQEVVLVWPRGEDPEPLRRVLRAGFLPHAACTGAEEGGPLERLARVTPLARDRPAPGRPAAYVCERGACRLPVTAPDDLGAALRTVRPYR
jgi:uncharacterized protein YyaL (SSP411 family)